MTFVVFTTCGIFPFYDCLPGCRAIHDYCNNQTVARSDIKKQGARQYS